jgi:hypothetical protein
LVGFSLWSLSSFINCIMSMLMFFTLNVISKRLFTF